MCVTVFTFFTFTLPLLLLRDLGNSAAKKQRCWSSFVSARWEPFGPERLMAADSAREFRRVRAESASD